MKKLARVVLCAVLSLAMLGSLSIAAQKKAAEKKSAGDPAKGEEVFKDKNCGVCHFADKDTKRIGPGLKDLFKHKEMWDGKPLTEANVRTMILKGGGKMTGFEDQMNAKEVDNLVAYLKTL